MNKCHRINKLNGQPSKLFDKLYKLLGDESLAAQAYKHFQSDNFKNNIFGDYELNYNLRKENKSYDLELDSRTDENGEPILYTEDPNKPYYIDKFNEKIYYPNNLGLEKYLSSDDIYLFSKTLALNYFIDKVKYNYNDQSFELSGNLRDFIENFLNEKINELSSSKNISQKLLSKLLAPTVNNIDNWLSEVEQYYNSININYKLDNQEIFNDENQTREDFVRQESFLKSSKDNVSKNIKLMLSLIKSDKRNKFNEYDFVEYDDVYATLNTVLSNKLANINENELLFDVFLDEIIKLSKVKPYLNNLFDVLNTNELNDDFKNQFTSAFNLFKKNYLVSEYIKDKNGNITYNVMNLTDGGSRKRNILNKWLFQLNEIVKKIPSDNINKTVKKFRLDSRKKRITESNIDSYLNDLIETLNSIGVNFSKKSLDYLMKDFDASKKLTLLNKINFIDKAYTKLNYALDFYKKNPNDNLFLNQDFFTKLAESEAFFQETGSDASVFTLGKTKWFYSNPSHLDIKVAEWQNEPQLLIDYYDNLSTYINSSHWLKYLSAAEIEDTEERVSVAKERLSEIQIGIFNSLQEKNNSIEGVDNKKISYLDSYVDYLNKTLAYRKGGKVFYKTALAADKSTEYQLHFGTPKNSFGETLDNLFSLKSNLEYDELTETFKVDDDVLEIFYNYWRGEYNRNAEEYNYIKENIEDVIKDKVPSEDLNDILTSIMTNKYLEEVVPLYGDILNFETDLNALTPNYHYKISKNGNFELGNATKMNLFKSLNDNSKLELYSIDGSPLYVNPDNLNSKISIKSDILNEINKIISDNIKLTYKELIKNNVFKYDKNAKLQNNYLDKDIFATYKKLYPNNLVFFNIASDYFLNSVMSQIEYSKMFSGDIAYYKNIVDYKKRVPATYTDGKYLMNLTSDEEYFNASIISSIEIGYQDMDSLKETLGEDNDEIYKYYEKRINDTDAQAWITPERWYFIIKKLGKNNSVVESAYNKMISDNKPVFTKSELKVLAQPLKGVYFDVRDGIPVYLKYSQAVLLPNLIKGTKLEKVYNSMVNDSEGNKLDYKNQIHELVTNDGIKVGYPTPSKIHTENGGLLDSYNLNISKIKLSNSKWKLQQDLPTKGIKEIPVGSQIQINIFQGIVNFLNELDENNKEKTFIIDDEEYTANEMIDSLNIITNELSNIGLQEFKDELGINDNYVIENEEVLYNSIAKQLKQRSDINNNNIKGLEMGLSPLGIPGINNLFQNVFSSLLNNKVVKIKTNGGGYIQMANYGISKENADKQNIIYTPWHDKNHLPMPEVYYDEKGRKRLKPSGIFLSGSFLAKIMPDYKKYSSKQLFGTAENNYKDGIIDKRILDNIIGYRIPNQGLSSNDALQILGILPEETGDTVIAYTGITTKTGSDFDIDKMYLMMPSFNIERKNYSKDTQTYKKVNQFAFNNLKGETKKDTINNILNFINKVDPLNELDLNLFKNVEYIKKLKENLENNNLRYFIKELDYAITNYEGDDTEILDVQKSILKLSISKIKYVDELVEGDEKKYYQNKLISFYKGVLTDVDVIKDVLRPIDLDFIEKNIKSIINDNDTNSDMIDLSGINDIIIKEQFRNGKAGLGQVVNQLIDSGRGSMAGLILKGDNNKFIADLKMGNKNSDNEPLFDLKNSEMLTESEINNYVKRYINKYGIPDNMTEKEFIAKFKENFTSLDLNTSMMVYINGFVDIAKDPYITKGNWLTQTNDTGIMLLRAGAHPFKINALLNQPFVKDYIAYKSRFDSVISNEKGSITTKFLLYKLLEKNNSDEDILINDIKYKKSNVYNSVVTYDNIKKYASAVLNYKSENKVEEAYEELNKNIRNLIQSKFKVNNKLNATDKNINKALNNLHEQIMDSINEFFTFDKSIKDNKFLTLNNMHSQIDAPSPSIQLRYLDYFNELVKKAKVLTESIRTSKPHTEGKGKNNITAIIYKNLHDKFRNNEGQPGFLEGFINKFEHNGYPTILNTYYSNSVLESIKIMEANPKFFVNMQKTPVNTFNYISQLVNNDSKLTNEKLGELLNKEYYTYILSSFKPLQTSKEERRELIKEIPSIFKELKDKYPDNLLLQELYPKKIGEVYYLAVTNTKKSNYYKNKMSRAWFNLLKQDPINAEKLIKYSYIISGFNNSDIQFHEFIPSEWFNHNRFNSHLISLKLNENALDYNFINQFFRNNLANTSLHTDITLDMDEIVIKDSPNALLVDFNDEYVTPPYIVRIQTRNRDMYYKQQDIDPKTGAFYYTRIQPLGYKEPGINLKEYDKRGSYNELNEMESMFKDNNYKSLNKSYIKDIIKKYPFQPINTYEVKLEDGMIENDIQRPVSILETPKTSVKEKLNPNNLDNSEESSILQEPEPKTVVKFNQKNFDEVFETMYRNTLESKRPDLDIEQVYNEMLEIGKQYGNKAVKDYFKKCKSGQ